MSNNLAKLDILVAHDTIAEEANHKLIIQTAAGQYVGKLYNPSDTDYQYVSRIGQVINNSRLSEYDEKNPTAISMVDVELRTSSIAGPFKMQYVCLFLDQILGVSIGNYEQPIEE